MIPEPSRRPVAPQGVRLDTTDYAFLHKEGVSPEGTIVEASQPR